MVNLLASPRIPSLPFSALLCVLSCDPVWTASPDALDLWLLVGAVIGRSWQENGGWEERGLRY